MGRDTLESIVLARLDSGVVEDMVKGDMGGMGESANGGNWWKDSFLGRVVSHFVFVGVPQSGQ